MKLSKLFVIALLAGTLGVIGCGSDDGGGSSNGTGGTPSNGGGDASQACSGPRCENNDAFRVACEAEFDDCIERNVNEAECLAGAEVACGAVL
jgi:hypothetical protein